MRDIKNLIIAATLCVALGSCGIYGKYQRPAEVTQVDSLYNYIAANNDTTSLATLSWRELFVDTKLQSLIEEGLSRNTNLNVARLNIEQAEVALRTSRLAYVPSFSVGAEGGVSSVNKATFTLSATASWEVDLFGKLRNAKLQNRAALEQSRAYTQAIRTQLIASIANNYYSLLMLDAQLAISRSTLVAWGENIRTMEALTRAGRLNQTSVLQSQASKVALEGSIVSIEEQIANLEISLSALLCRPTQRIDRGDLASTKFPESVASGVSLDLVSNRPDVRAAEYNLMQSFYATNVARSSLYPTITIGGSAGYSDGAGVIANPAEMIYSAVGSIVQPLFNRGTLRAQLDIAKSAQEQSLLEFNQALLDAAAEVNTALTSWQSSIRRIALDNKERAILERALRSSELLMKHGNINYLEVLTAQFTLLQSQLSNVTNRYDEIASVVALYYSLGGGE